MIQAERVGDFLLDSFSQWKNFCRPLQWLLWKWIQRKKTPHLCLYRPSFTSNPSIFLVLSPCHQIWFLTFTHSVSPKNEIFSSCDLELWPMTLIQEQDTDRMKVNYTMPNTYRNTQIISFHNANTQALHCSRPAGCSTMYLDHKAHFTTGLRLFAPLTIRTIDRLYPTTINLTITLTVYSHFGPRPLRSFVWGLNWQRTEVTKDRSGCPDQS